MLTLDIQEQGINNYIDDLDFMLFHTVTETPTTGPTTQAPTPEPTTQAPTPEPTTTQAPTPGPTTQASTPEPTPVPTTQAPTTQPTTQGLTTPPEDQTTAAGTGQFARGTEIAGPLVGGVVGVLLLVLTVVVVVGFVVYILTRRRFTNKWTPEVVSEHQLAEGSQRGVISNGIQGAETGEYSCLQILNAFFSTNASIYSLCCLCIVKVVKLFI